MIRFEHTILLYGLLLIPVFIILFWMMIRWKKKAIRRFGDSSLVASLMPLRSAGKTAWKFMILILAFGLLVVGAANPQIGSKLEEIKRKGIDMIIAVDVSNSMKAEDIAPSRLERARQSISKLIDRLQGDRIGIIVFAGKAYMQLPITTDYAAAKMFVQSVNTETVPVQGTAIGEAIRVAAKSFEENDHSRAIIVITDGENHEGDAVEQARLATEKEINVYTIGMGSPEGGPIPVFNKYNNRIGFKKDRQGNTVITKLNEQMLQQIAAAGNGKFVRANNSKAGLDEIFDDINKLEETEIESKMYSEYEDRFQYFIGVALLLLIIEVLMVERKSKWRGKINLFG
ncbi:MAG: VWA domain-containing protein [Bacteroidales bacterium]|nr:VWA domain-containing protein [Bacteroidales bacterium]MCF8344051.1 VWA domain-containing protein [Bacteroidales bacterium]MCF8351141.1 VWA domain-containing protein [Bacteroidales bacterium]MCF8376606.1 VWA domain-containing protein [Bacteroidales bacterium]MCF8400672.1 VWA domain-containing protein [Bacteroidales bacterium]